jgi:hypothetical protein
MQDMSKRMNVPTKIEYSFQYSTSIWVNLWICPFLKLLIFTIVSFINATLLLLHHHPEEYSKRRIRLLLHGVVLKVVKIEALDLDGESLGMVVGFVALELLILLVLGLEWMVLEVVEPAVEVVDGGVVPDMAVPDMAVPDMAVPDMAVPDIVVDKAAPDKVAPDIVVVDIGMVVVADRVDSIGTVVDHDDEQHVRHHHGLLDHLEILHHDHHLHNCACWCNSDTSFHNRSSGRAGH